jgi:putative membrane protein
MIARIAVLACGFVLATGSALGQEKKPPPEKTLSDKDFMTGSARTNLLEIELSRLPATQSMNVDVQAFGQKMVTEHQRLNEQLTELAAKKKVKLPDKLTEQQQKMVDDMMKLSGEPFDRRYMAHMVSDHEKAVESFKTASTDAQDAEVKSFAAGALAKLEEHLKEARELNAKVTGTPEKPKPDKPAPKPDQPDKPDKPKPERPEKPKPPGRPDNPDRP